MNHVHHISYSILTAAVVVLSDVTQAHAYEPGDFICRVQDLRPEDGIQFYCHAHDNTLIADGFVVGGDDWGRVTAAVNTGEGGEPCNGTIKCDLQFGERIIPDVEPGGYIFRLASFPSFADVKCFCR